VRHVREHEQAALGSAIVEDALARQLAERLEPQMFFGTDHQLIARAIRELAHSESKADVISVLSILEAWGKLGEAGGKKYVVETLLRMEFRTPHFDTYVTEVRKAYYQREIEKAAAKCVKDPSEPNLRELQRLAVLRASEVSINYFSLKRDLPGLLPQLLGEEESEDRQIVDTGFKNLDKLLQGARGGDVIGLGARPGGGKTALALRLARNWCKEKKRVFVFTTEMMAEAIVERILPAVSGIEAWKFRRHKLSLDERTRVRESAAQLWESHDLSIMGRTRPSLETIRAVIAKLKPDIVIVDYLQRCRFPKSDNRAYAIEAFMEGFKDTALETKKIFLLLAQLKRETDYNKGRPKLADFRDSGSVEHQCDSVLLLHRLGEDEEKPHCEIEAIVAKNRNGLIGATPLIFDKDFVNFCESIDQVVQRGESGFTPYSPDTEEAEIHPDCRRFA